MEDPFNIRLETNDAARVLHVDGELSAVHAGEMAKVLFESLDAGGPAVLDLAGITDIDLAGLQVLCSAHRTFLRQGGVLELRTQSDAVRQNAGDAGYCMRSSVCPYRRDDNCLWK